MCRWMLARLWFGRPFPNSEYHPENADDGDGQVGHGFHCPLVVNEAARTQTDEERPQSSNHDAARYQKGLNRLVSCYHCCRLLVSLILQPSRIPFASQSYHSSRNSRMNVLDVLEPSSFDS